MKYFKIFDSTYRNNEKQFAGLSIDAQRRLMIKLIFGAATSGTAFGVLAQSEGGELPPVNVVATPEYTVGMGMGGFQWDDSGSPSDQFFAELNSYLMSAMETVEYYIEVTKSLLGRGVEDLKQFARVWGFAHQQQREYPGKTAFNAWATAITNINQRISIAVQSNAVYASAPSAPFAGLYYWTFGNGATVTTPIETLGLNVSVGEVGINGQSTNAVPLVDFINSHQEAGSYQYNSNPFGYATYDDNWFTGKFIGNFSMQSEGILTRNVDGSWDFNGSVRAAVPDRYDANRSNYRDPTNEDWTSLLRQLPGTEYDVDITGTLPLYLNSK